jgi:ABC-2 type transport system permease protein
MSPVQDRPHLELSARPSLLRVLWAFIRRDLKITLSYRFQAFFQLAGSLSILITFFFLSLMMRRVESSIPSLSKYGGTYFGFAVIGVAVSIYIDTSLRTFAASIRMAQMTGTFEAMLTTRTPVGTLVAGSAFYTLLNSTGRSFVLLFFGGTLFGVPFHLETWPAVLIIVVLTIATTAALGIFSAGFIVLFKQGDPLNTAISGLSWLLSGVLYPKEILPIWVQKVASFLPMTRSLESLRLALLQGVPFDDLRGDITSLLVMAAIGIPLSLVWFRWAVARAQVAGSLARY